MTNPSEILDFWFAPGQAPNWFEKNPDFDAEVRVKLGAAHDAAAAGALEAWRETAEGCLALVILLDQVPRNLFRGEARAFATDAQARAVTRQALDRGFGADWPEARQMFLYLPLEHSEDLSDQEDCCRLMEGLAGNPDWADYARRHRDIVARFGRFPHRNAALGRASTPEELAFLAQPGSSF